MKNVLIRCPSALPLILTLGIFCGCDESAHSVSELNEPHTEAKRSDSPPLARKQNVRIELTESAALELRGFLKTHGGEGNYLIVGVDLEAATCTGFRYELNLGERPDPQEYAMTHSQGINIAVAKDDVKFLDGTVLDFKTTESGERGFEFKNPNEKKAPKKNSELNSKPDSSN